MYNRYIPQADGSFRKTLMEDAPPAPPEPEEPEPVLAATEAQLGNPPAGTASEPPRRKHAPNRQQLQHRPPRKEAPQTAPLGITGFLRQLIPPNLDAEDLIVVLLLLLMSGDSQEEQNGALLTLALYLFL